VFINTRARLLQRSLGSVRAPTRVPPFSPCRPAEYDLSERSQQPCHPWDVAAVDSEICAISSNSHSVELSWRGRTARIACLHLPNALVQLRALNCCNVR
jgi:hypothetical protein